jgi:hypothetical protein
MAQGQAFPGANATANHEAGIVPLRTRSRHDYGSGIKRAGGKKSVRANHAMVSLIMQRKSSASYGVRS